MAAIGGVVGGAVTLVVPALLSREDAFGFLAVWLGVTAGVYLGFALQDGRSSALGIEMVGMALFVAVATVALVREAAWLLAAGWVEDGKFITSAGVSAGIDMALALVARLTDEATARMVQLAIEYDPHPPFGGIDWGQVNRDVYEPMLGPMVQRQLADRPELLAKLSG